MKDNEKERIDLLHTQGRMYPMWQHFKAINNSEGVLTLVSDQPVEPGDRFKLYSYNLDVMGVIDKRKPRGVHSRPCVFYALAVNWQ